MNPHRIGALCAVLLSLVACNENEFHMSSYQVEEPDTGDFGPDDGLDGPEESDADTDADADTDTEEREPWVPDPNVPPPPEVPEDCANGVLATWNGGMVWVGSWNNPSAAGTINAPQEGWYHAYSTQLAESGASQRNESSYFRVTNTTAPSGKPYYGNCGDEWIVEDVDNFGTPGATRLYIGTFFLEAGANTLEMEHYCPLYRAGSCGGFHETSASSSTCSSGNVNSVHFEGDAICLMQGVP